jgi:hypothetical protein
MDLNTLDEIALDSAFSSQFGHKTSLQRFQVGSVNALQRSLKVSCSHQPVAKFTQRALASLIGEKLDHPIGL